MEEITKGIPVSSVKLGNNKLLVIVGRVEPALALLEGRSSIYRDRPQLVSRWKKWLAISCLEGYALYAFPMETVGRDFAGWK
ncbi:hypothetical protein PSTT_10934 [Puccinia striiformis]|uniref:Uncharacterized protein n=1 Tax=Puccinia striiformis TaxID=27350 RepID=A0A2S4V2B7_9BASI|nr:hypothetical protein PSTT_10934 [Puccinia striiformis]